MPNRTTSSRRPSSDWDSDEDSSSSASPLQKIWKGLVLAVSVIVFILGVIFAPPRDPKLVAKHAEHNRCLAKQESFKKNEPAWSLRSAPKCGTGLFGWWR